MAQEVKMSQKYFGYIITVQTQFWAWEERQTNRLPAWGKPVVTFWSPERQVQGLLL